MNGKKVALWVVTIIVALVFLSAGVMKLVNYQGSSSAEFAHWGFPDWFRIVIGVVEVVGVVCLLISATAVISAEVLIAVMIGAAITHIMYDSLYWVLLPTSLIIGLLVIIWLRKSKK